MNTLPRLALSLVLLTTARSAALALSIDFNTNASPTETSFLAFTGGNGAANQPTPLFQTFSGIGIGIAGASSTDAITGLLNSTLNNVAFNSRTGPADSGAFTYGELYRDFVYTNDANLSTYIQFSGLAAGAVYSLRFYASDPNNSKVTTINNITSGSPTLFGSITSTANSYTSNDQYSFLGQATANEKGLLTFQFSGAVTAGGSSTYATVNGLVINPIPEPSIMALSALGGLALLARRRRP